MPVDWTAAFPGGARVDLPTYPFQRRRYWPTPAEPVVAAEDTAFWDAVETADLDALAAMDVEVTDGLGDALPALSEWRRRRRQASVTDALRYQVTWKPVALTGRPAGTFLVVGGTPDLLDTLGRHVRLVTGDLADAPADLAGVISFAALDDSREPGHPSTPTAFAANLRLVQDLGAAGIDAPLWCLTRGGAPEQALVWAFGRVVAQEHLQRWGGVVEIPETFDDRAAGRLASVLAQSAEQELVIRETGIAARRLVRAPLRAARPAGGDALGHRADHRRHGRARREGGPLVPRTRGDRPAAGQPFRARRAGGRRNWRRNSARPWWPATSPTATSSPRCWPSIR